MMNEDEKHRNASVAVECAAAGTVAGTATVLCFLLKAWLSPENLIMVYLAGVAVAGSTLGR